MAVLTIVLHFERHVYRREVFSPTAVYRVFLFILRFRLLCGLFTSSVTRVKVGNVEISFEPRPNNTLR